MTFTSHTDLITATENTASAHLIHFCDPYFDQAEARDWTERWPHSAPILVAGINIREDPGQLARRTWTQSPTIT